MVADKKLVIETYPVLKKLFEYDRLGEEQAMNGTLLIGRAPHIAPLAWLHSIYPPLSENQLRQIEHSIKISIPKQYRMFLSTTNGLNFFNTTLSLYGLRSNFKRNIQDVWQPFDIVAPNTIEKPLNAAKDDFIIGTYDWDGSYVYIDSKFERVHLCHRENSTSLYSWESFDAMLELEINRLIRLFDDKGKTFHEEKSTLPL